jgi:hypothetical protein
MITHKITLTSGRKSKTFYYTKKPIKADREAAIAAFGKDLNVSVEVSKVKLKKVS